MDLRNKGLVEQDSLLDVFEDVIEPFIADLKANFDYVLEGKDLEIKQLREQIERMKYSFDNFINGR